MRPHLPAAILLFLPLMLRAQAPTVEELLAKHLEARGGLARIRAIRSLTSTGRIEIGPMVLALRIENPRGAFRSDTTFQGLTKTEAFDGRRGWIIDPFAGGGPAPRPMGPEELRQVALQMDFDGPLVDYRDKGHAITLAGKTRVGEADAYVLRVALKGGNELLSYLDAATCMEIKATNKAVSQGREVVVDTMIGDYRAVDGVQLPFSLEIRPQGQAQGLRILLDQVVANAPMEAARFAMPAPK